MADEMNSSYVAAISVTMVIVGFILGVVIATIVLLRFQTLYTKLQTLCKRTAPATTSNYDKGRSETNSMAFSAYSEIDERNTRTLVGNSRGQVADTKHLTYEEYSSDKQKYTNLKLTEPKGNRSNYEDIDVNKARVRPGSGLSCPVYHILEPGTNHRLPVSPLPTNTSQADDSHVYFKLEPGSDRVISVPVCEVKDEIQTANNRKSEIHTYFMLQPQGGALEPVTINPHDGGADNQEPKYYILEKST